MSETQLMQAKMNLEMIQRQHLSTLAAIDMDQELADMVEEIQTTVATALAEVNERFEIGEFEPA